ncbi:glycosyltransferase family 4 protein [Pseudonocardia halophobica]
MVLPSTGPLSEMLTQLGVEVRTDPSMAVLRKEILRSPTKLVLLSLNALCSLVRTAIMIRESRASICYISTVTIPVPILAARLLRVRSVLHVHEAETALRPVFMKLLTFPARLASDVICISRAARDFVSNGGRWREVDEKTIIVPNTVRTPGLVDPLPHERPEILRLLLPGRLSPRKGTDVAVAALAELRTRGIRAELTIIGSAFSGYEWYVSEIRKVVSTLKLGAFCTIHDFRSDIDDVYREHHVVIVPSRIEPFGLVALEGMARGRIVIASDVGGLSDIIHNRHDGVLFPPGSPTTLADAVEYAWLNWQTALQISSNAERTVAIRYSEDAFARSIQMALLGGEQDA